MPTQLTRRAAPGADDEDISTLMIRSGIGFAKRHYGLSGMWILGLLVLQFGTGFTVSEEAQAEHDAIIQTIDTKAYNKAEKALWKTESAYTASKGFFWSCDNVCQANKAKYLKAKARFDAVSAEQKATISEANSKLGIMSKQGVQETRDLFWDMFAKGRGFAKRSSWYDLLFMGIGSMGRDESLIAFLLRWLLNVLMNFTMGLFGAFVAFAWWVGHIISSYQPDLMTRLTFYFLAFTAGATIVVSFLVAMYGAAAGTAYVVLKAAHNSARLEAEQRRRLAQQQGQRAHYD